MKTILLFCFSLLSLQLISQSCDRIEYIEDYEESFVETDLFDTQMNWTGNTSNCNPGDFDDIAREYTLTRINYFRRICGLDDDVTFDPVLDDKCQDLALMLKLNGLSHDPPSSWTCYTSDGAFAASKSNIATLNASKAIKAYIQDQSSKSVGHRRWILNPPTKKMGLGSTNNSSSLYVIVSPQTPTLNPDFVAYPSPGMFLKPITYWRWSFGKKDANYDEAEIIMTREDGLEIPITVEPIKVGQALNSIVWMPIIPTMLEEISGSDIEVNIQVNNVLIDGEYEDFAYQVILIDEEYTAPIISISPAGCGQDNGSAVVDFDHGATDIQWSNGSSGVSFINNLQPGEYTVTVTDKFGCEILETFTIDSEEIQVEASITNATQPVCEGQPSLLSGPPNVFNYQWSTGESTSEIEVTASGEYFLTITDSNGCSDVASYILENLENPEIVIFSTNEIPCHGDITELYTTIIGDHIWSTGDVGQSIDVFISGVYGLTVTNDNGCSSSESVEIFFIENPIAEIFPDKITGYCEGEEATLTAFGGDSFLWEDGSTSQSITTSIAGTYQVTVANEFNCMSAIDFELEFTPIPELIDITGNLEVNTSENFTYETQAVQDAVYQWQITNGEIIEGNGTPYITVQWNQETNGELCVKAINNGECESETVCIEVDIIPLSTKEIVNADVLISPNPAVQYLEIKTTIDFTSMRIINSLGQSIQAGKFQSSINVSDLPEGLYYLYLDNEKEKAIKRFIKI